MEGFWDLDTDRFPDGPIRWSIAREWFIHRGHAADLWGIFWECIKELDVAYSKVRAADARRTIRRSKGKAAD